MNMELFKKLQYLQLALIAGVLVSFGLGFAGVWVFAPPVGGEWWPYVRFVFAFVGGLIVASVLRHILASLLAYFFMDDLMSAVEDIFDSGSEDGPWSDEDISEFMDSFSVDTDGATDVNFKEKDEE